MNARVVVLAVVALVVVVLLLWGGDPTSDAPITPQGPPTAADGKAPQLEAKGEAPKEQPPTPAEPPPVPAATPERPVEVGALRVQLRGRVLDPKGTPLPDVPVRVYAYFESTRPKPAKHAETVTDAEGRFGFDFQPDTQVTTRDPWVRMRIAAFHPDWVMAVGSAYVNSRSVDAAGYVREDIELRMRPAFRLLCRVRDTDGRPIAGATCALEQFYGRKHWVDGRPVQTTSNAAGEAHLRLPLLGEDVILLRLHGHHAFRVSAPGYATVYARVRVPDAFEPESVFETEAVLTVPYEIRGVVRDDTGATLADKALSVTGRRVGTWGVLVYTRWSDHAVRTQPDGSFVLPAVEAGTWRLEFQVEGHRPARLEAAAGVTDLDVRLERLAPTVLVFRDATTRAYLRVQSHSVELEGGGGSRTSGGAADARLDLDDLPPGTHEITVRFAGRAQPFTTSFEAQPGVQEPLVFDVPAPQEGATLTGIVVNAEGQPIDDAWMTLAARVADDADEAEVEDLEWQTQADGTFRFEGVMPGRYTLEVEANDLADKHVPIEVGEASARSPLRIVLTAGATLRVEFPALPDDANWRYDVRVLRDGSELSGRFMGADERNAVVFEHQTPGKVWVVLESSTFRTRRYDGDPYMRRITLVEGEQATVSYAGLSPLRVAGRVVGKDGKPLAAGGLQLRRIGPATPLTEVNANMFFGSKRAPTDAQGGFSFGGLLPGRYAIANLSKDGKPITFVLADASLLDLTLTSDH